MILERRSGNGQRPGGADRADRRVDAAAGHDGHLRHPDADAARGRTRPDLAAQRARQGLRTPGRVQTPRTPGTRPPPFHTHVHSTPTITFHQIFNHSIYPGLVLILT